MDTDDFKYWGNEMIEFICNYLNTLHERKVIPDVEPGYLKPLLPDVAPELPENWKDILDDVEKYIITGLTHWQHPRFHAYFPSGNSFPSIMADMLSNAFGSIGFSWAASPAVAELEIVVVEWIAKMINLPSQFSHETTGGGVIQSSASDCVLLALIAARHKAIAEHKGVFEESGEMNPETAVLSRLVGYHSSLAHSCVEKAGMIAFVKMRAIEVDENCSMNNDSLEKAIKDDLKHGLIPFFIAGTLGTTACCSFDNLKKIGEIAKRFEIWFHVDAAYAGSALICEEFQYLMEGIEDAMSFNFNPNKWLLVNFDCSLFWVADRDLLTMSMVVDPVYLQHKYSSKAIDFRNWGIPLSRRFRSLKLWFVIRIYGTEKLRQYIRNHVKLAKYFETLVRSDDRFEITNKVEMGLVCFRLKNSNVLTQCLLRTINESRELHMVPAVVNEVYVIRFCVVRESASEDDINAAWNVIQHYTDEIITAENSLRQWKENIECRRKNKIKLLKTSVDSGGKNNESPNSSSAVIEDQLSHVKLSPSESHSEFDLADDPEGIDENESQYSCLDEDFDYVDLAQIDDSELIDLAYERLKELKMKGDHNGFNLLQGHLLNMGIKEVQNYSVYNLDDSVPEESPGEKQDGEIDISAYTCEEKSTITPKTPSTDNSRIKGKNSSNDSNLNSPITSSTPQVNRHMQDSGNFTGEHDKCSGSTSKSSNLILARLVSMVMNASSNRRELSQNTKSASCYVKKNKYNLSSMANNKNRTVHFTGQQSDSCNEFREAFIPGINNMTRSRRPCAFPNKTFSEGITGSRFNAERLDESYEDDVFVPNDDYGVGLVKEGTLARLKKIALLKMIYDVEPKKLIHTRLDGKPPMIRRFTDTSIDNSLILCREVQFDKEKTVSEEKK